MSANREYKYDDLAALIDARDNGELDGRHIEIVVDDDSVLVATYDRPPSEWGEDEEIEPAYVANLGDGNPRAALVEALAALGFEARRA